MGFDRPADNHLQWLLCDPAWSVWLREPALPAQAETLLALANGHVGVRGGREEQHSATDGVLLSAVYERVPIEYHESLPGFAKISDTRVRAADGKRVRILVGESQEDITTGKLLDCHRVLDIRRGILVRRTRWQTQSGHVIDVDAKRLVPLHGQAELAISLSVRSSTYSGPITVISSIEPGATAARADDPRIGSTDQAALLIESTAKNLDGVTLRQYARRSGIYVSTAQTHRLGAGWLASATTDTQINAAEQRFSATLERDQEVSLDKFVAWAVGDAHTDTTAVATRLARALRVTGFATLAERQTEAWGQFWSNADLGIDGDDELNAGVRFNVFHIRQSAPSDGQFALSAKGLTGEGYEGHVFWDTEMFALPLLQMVAPQLVRASLSWRYRTLERARAHAREMNHPVGALYPWRTIAGDEGSGFFPAGSAQYHINADIAYALRLHALGSLDNEFQAQAAEVLFETARIWVQIGQHSPRHQGAFCLYEVTGPDEYSALVDNDYYTNRMAQLHLKYAAEVAHTMRRTDAGTFNQLSAKLSLTGDEISAWQRAADTMYLPINDQLGVTPQDEGFLSKPQWPFGENTSTLPLLLQFHPLTLYRYQICKQPNVILAHVMAGEHVSEQQKRRDFDYYEPITVHDSSLSASTWSILAAELGLTDKALKYFTDSARLDLDDLHGNASHGAHMAAMAGSWMSLVWGFGGLRIGEDGTLKIDPSLPSNWTSYYFTLSWKGSTLRVRVDRSGATYQLLKGEALHINHAGTLLHVDTNPCAPLPLSSRSQRSVAKSARPLSTPIAAVIFDLDGVLTDTASLHFKAWKNIADEIAVPFDEQDNMRLKGVSREKSLALLLEKSTRVYTAEEKRSLAVKKNEYFKRLIADFSADQLFPGAMELLMELRRCGIRIALASASHNAEFLVGRLGIRAMFDHLVDPHGLPSKPDPALFLSAARALNVPPLLCVGVEDAPAGIAAIKAAGMLSIGIGSRTELRDADAVFSTLLAIPKDAFGKDSDLLRHSLIDAERRVAAPRAALDDSTFIINKQVETK